MDNFVVHRHRFERDPQLFLFQTLHASSFARGVIRQTASEFLTGEIGDGDDIAFFEIAFDIDNTDREKTAAFADESRHCPGIDTDSTFRSGRQADPALAGGPCLPLGQDERADRLTIKDRCQRAIPCRF